MEIYTHLFSKNKQNTGFEGNNRMEYWVIAKLPKQSDLGDCSNWKWVTLLSITSNVIAIILMHRLSIELVETLYRVQPYGIKGKSCTKAYLFWA